MSLYDLVKFMSFPQTVSFIFVLLVLVHSTYFMNNMIIITNRFIILLTQISSFMISLRLNHDLLVFITSLKSNPKYTSPSYFLTSSQDGVL
jgi:hypothetical protein